MIINGETLLCIAPIMDMLDHSKEAHGRSYGLSEDGYDIRLKQKVEFHPPYFSRNPDQNSTFGYTVVHHEDDLKYNLGRTALGSSVEAFAIPGNLSCEFRNKSKNARLFLDAALGTGAKPGWAGFLTIELVFFGLNPVVLEAGTPILSAIFTPTKEVRQYDGEFQCQPDMPVAPTF